MPSAGTSFRLISSRRSSVLLNQCLDVVDVPSPHDLAPLGMDAVGVVAVRVSEEAHSANPPPPLVVATLGQRPVSDVITSLPITSVLREIRPLAPDKLGASRPSTSLWNSSLHYLSGRQSNCQHDGR